MSLTNKMIHAANNGIGIFGNTYNYDLWVNPELHDHCTNYNLKIEVVVEVKEVHVVKVPTLQSSTKKRKIITRFSVATSSDSSDEDTAYNSQQKKIKNPYKSIGCRNNFRNDIIDILKTWYEDNIDHPYPSQQEIVKIADITGLSIVQVRDWFTNYRLRIKKKN